MATQVAKGRIFTALISDLPSGPSLYPVFELKIESPAPFLKPFMLLACVHKLYR